jgi:hypothetical protein
MGQIPNGKKRYAIDVPVVAGTVFIYFYYPLTLFQYSAGEHVFKKHRRVSNQDGSTRWWVHDNEWMPLDFLWELPLKSHGDEKRQKRVGMPPSRLLTVISMAMGFCLSLCGLRCRQTTLLRIGVDGNDYPSETCTKIGVFQTI